MHAGFEAGNLPLPNYYGVTNPSQPTCSQQPRTNSAATETACTSSSRTSQERMETSSCNITVTHGAVPRGPPPNVTIPGGNPLVAWGRAGVQAFRTLFGERLPFTEAGAHDCPRGASWLGHTGCGAGSGPGGGGWLGHGGQNMGEGSAAGRRRWFRATGSTRYAWYVIAMRAMINGVGLTLGRL
jgi:hypothetical protein